MNNSESVGDTRSPTRWTGSQEGITRNEMKLSLPQPHSTQSSDVSVPSASRSKAVGQRKALIIGINYFGQYGQLRRSIDNVQGMAAYLQEHCSYRRADMLILTDGQRHKSSQPTKENIRSAMRWLVRGATPGDALFLHYSGIHPQKKCIYGLSG